MFERMTYEDIFLADFAMDAWREEVETWIKNLGVDPEELDYEDYSKFESEYRDELEAKLGWESERTYWWRNR